MAGKGRLGILDRFLNWDAGPPRNTSCLEAIATIGIDIGKNTFHLVGLDKNGPGPLCETLILAKSPDPMVDPSSLISQPPNPRPTARASPPDTDRNSFERRTSGAIVVALDPPAVQ